MEEEAQTELDAKRRKYFVEYFKNLFEGINYYKQLPETVETDYTSYIQALSLGEHALETLSMQYSIAIPEKVLAEA